VARGDVGLGEADSWGGRGGLAGHFPLRSVRLESQTTHYPSCGRVAGWPDEWDDSPVLGAPQKTKMAKSMINKCGESDPEAGHADRTRPAARPCLAGVGRPQRTSPRGV